MPKKQIFGSIIILVVLCFVCMFIYDEFKDRKDDRKILLLTDTGKSQLILYYNDNENNNYYLYGLNEVVVDYGDRTLELDKALEARQISINDIYSIIGEDHKISYDDGGSVKINNDKISFLQCNTLDGNKDYYFGPSNMEYREGFCKNSPYVCSFTKTYLILDICNSNNENYVYLTLRMFQDEEIVTVRVDKSLINNILEDNYYEFEFASLGSSDLNDIKSVFENHKLISINATDKIESEQINDNVCK